MRRQSRETITFALLALLAAPLPAQSPPTMDAPPRGVLFGPWHLPSDEYGSYPATGAYLGWQTVASGRTPAEFMEQLREAKGARMSVFVNLVPRRASPGGGPDLAGYLKSLQLWKPYAGELVELAEDGVVAGIVGADEPECSSCWKGEAWSDEQMIEVAEATQALIPDVPFGFREKPTELARRSPELTRMLDFGWWQDEGPLHPAKAPKTAAGRLSLEIAAARALGVSLVTGMNVLDGGDGSSGVPGTYRNAASKEVNRWQMSPAEIVSNGTLFLKTPQACAVVNWRYGKSATGSQFQGITNEQFEAITGFDDRMEPQLDSLARLARSVPPRSCKRPAGAGSR